MEELNNVMKTVEEVTPVLAVEEPILEVEEIIKDNSTNMLGLAVAGAIVVGGIFGIKKLLKNRKAKKTESEQVYAKTTIIKEEVISEKEEQPEE